MKLPRCVLFELPRQLKDFSITVMDGPFFSIMPFPSKNLYTLSHVRYTPHESWIDDENTSAERIKTRCIFEKIAPLNQTIGRCIMML